MTELSDADREMAVKILAAWESLETVAEGLVDDFPERALAMLDTARTLVTAEILAAAHISEDKVVEAGGRAIADVDGEDYMEDCVRFDKYARAAMIRALATERDAALAAKPAAPTGETVPRTLSPQCSFRWNVETKWLEQLFTDPRGGVKQYWQPVPAYRPEKPQ